MFATALALVTFAAAPVPKGAAKEAQDALQGEWKMVEFIKGGSPLRPEHLAKSVEIKGDQLLITDDKRTDASTFKLDPKATPAALDIAPGKKRSEPGVKAIYKLEKNKLTICFGMDDTDRPTKFESPADSKIGLMVLERVKK